MMKNIFVKIKHKKLILSTVLVLAIAVVGTTMAVLTSATGSLTNIFKPQVLQTKIVEKLDEGTVTTDRWITKEIRVQNESTSLNDAYIRVRLTVSPESVLAGNNGSVTIQAGDQTLTTLHPADGTKFNGDTEPGDYWIYNAADGYFYYNRAVAPNTTTEPLVTAVKITSETEKLFDVTAYQESVVGVAKSTNVSVTTLQEAFAKADKSN